MPGTGKHEWFECTRTTWTERADESEPKSGRGPPHSRTLARFTMTPKPREASWTAPALWRFAFGIEPGVAASRQSAANRTGAFQMAAFCRKPLRRAKPFPFSTGEILRRKLLVHGNVLMYLGVGYDNFLAWSLLKLFRRRFQLGSHSGNGFRCCWFVHPFQH